MGTNSKCGVAVLYEVDVHVMGVELLPSLGSSNVKSMIFEVSYMKLLKFCRGSISGVAPEAMTSIPRAYYSVSKVRGERLIQARMATGMGNVGNKTDIWLV